MSDIIEVMPEDFSEKGIQDALDDKIILDYLNGVKGTKIKKVISSIIREKIRALGGDNE